MMWSEAHRPASIPDMIGNEKARAELVTWLARWKMGTKPVLLVGEPGTGKTTIARLVAARFGYDIVGINASDARSKSKINELLGPVMSNAGLRGKTLVFVDEVDGIHGRSDFGGSDALVRILQEPTVPIILAANSNDSAKMRAISKASNVIRFAKIPPRLLGVYLTDVIRREGAKISPGSIVNIISESRGDIRAMFNLAQSLAHGFDPEISHERGTIAVDDAVAAFFGAESREGARIAVDRMHADIREKISSIYSSIVNAKALDVKTAAKMLNAVSEADIIHGRIMRTQQWRMLRYLSSVLSGAYAPGKSVPYSKFSISWDLLNKIRWDANAIKAFARYAAPLLHASQSEFITEHMPYILYCMKRGSIDPDIDEEYEGTIEKEMAKI